MSDCDDERTETLHLASAVLAAAETPMRVKRGPLPMHIRAGDVALCGLSIDDVTYWATVGDTDETLPWCAKCVAAAARKPRRLGAHVIDAEFVAVEDGALARARLEGFRDELVEVMQLCALPLVGSDS